MRDVVDYQEGGGDGAVTVRARESSRALVSYDERQAHWEWCREYLDRECLYRVDETHPEVPSKVPGGTYIWQLYSRRATFHPLFARRLGLLFWEHFKPVFESQPFQICSCAPSGPPIGMAIQNVARALGIRINHFIARREPKTWGADNWFDGWVAQLPVMLVDDVAASTVHMKFASARIQLKLGLPLHRNYFALINKVGRGFTGQHTENYLDNELVSFFTMNNICLTVEAFKDRYGHVPKWTGLVR